MKEATLKQHLRKEWKPCHVTTVEGSIAFGMPDIFVSTLTGREWIELKQRYGRALYFRANQLVWMAKELELGHDTWILWYDDKLRATKYSILRHWAMEAKQTKITVEIELSEMLTGSFQDIKNVIFEGLQTA